MQLLYVMSGSVLPLTYKLLLDAVQRLQDHLGNKIMGYIYIIICFLCMQKVVASN